jgi:hypothetical protein
LLVFAENRAAVFESIKGKHLKTLKPLSGAKASAGAALRPVR